MSDKDFKNKHFRAHPHMSDEVNYAMLESELQGGARLDEMEIGERLEVQTRNTIYIIEKCKDGFTIFGNMKYCPEPTKVRIPGSTFGGSMLKMHFVGRGMYMEFALPTGKTVTTTQIEEVRKLS